MQQLRLPASSTKYDYVVLAGGLDLLTPTLQLRPGYVRDALNWEVSINGGYSRIEGYERVDGRASPSAQVYTTLTCNITAAISAGQTITGATSAATGQVISVTGDIIAYVLGTGTFVAGENLTVAAVVKASITSLGGVGPAADFDATNLALTANVYRALIGAVPGSGSILGVAQLAGTLYAWRNNAGGTAMAIYKTSGSGWTLVPLLYEVSFTAGGTAYAVGSTLTQGGVNATVKAVSLQSGAWGGTAVGRLIIDAPSGGNFAAGASVGGGTATLSGVETAITLLPNGRVQTDLGNFGGGQKLYGCDGVNRGFEFDGVTLCPLATGNTIDIPQHVLVHKDHLFYAFGTNFQHSGITTPYAWTSVAGSAAYRVSDTITAFLRQPGDQSSGAMSISTASSTLMLYGSSAANFAVVPFEESAGAKKYSAQRIGGQSVVYSDIGAISLTASQAFGNFDPASLTMKIRPFTQVRRDLCTGSIVNREKSQYRVFFSDGYGLYMTLVNRKMLGSMPVNFPNPVTCTCAGTALGGKETSFFGSTNGFVYQLDAGTSHDGAPITSYWTLTYANEGNSRILKKYVGVSFEMQGTSYVSFDMTYELGYGDSDRVQGSMARNVAKTLAPVYWDTFVWDTFVWDGKNIAPANVEMRGVGENVSIRIDSSSDKYAAFTVNSLTLHYRLRKALKK